MRNIKYKIVVLLTVVGLLTSCGEDWLDVNKSPNQPDQPYIGLLLPGIEKDIADVLTLNYMSLGYISAVYTHQLTSRESIDKYGMTGGSIQFDWNTLYSGPLTDLDLLISMSEENDYAVYGGVAKILKAYTYSFMVDVWGDIPFSEVNTGILSPVFDDDEAIYAKLFLMIDDGIADLQNTASVNEFVPGGDDLIYGGDVTKWIKAANTLKLKMYNQVREHAMFDATAVTALLGGALIEDGDDFMMYYGSNGNPENRNPAFVSDWVGNQISLYVSPWMFEIMNADRVYTVADPRLPYYICNQYRATPENDPEYANGDFISIYFGSDGNDRDHAGRSTFSMVGLYGCGGKYDDGVGVGTLGGDNATGTAPQRFITYADRLFIEAELALEEGITVNGTAATLLDEAVTASFNLVNLIADTEGAPYIAAADIATYLAEVNAVYTGNELETIMTQKWLQSYGSNVDSYTDYRRTGFPVLFDPNSNSGSQSGGPDGSGPVPTSLTRSYPVSYPWATPELEANKNAPPQKTIATDKVFWDVN